MVGLSASFTMPPLGLLAAATSSRFFLFAPLVRRQCVPPIRASLFESKCRWKAGARYALVGSTWQVLPWQPSPLQTPLCQLQWCGFSPHVFNMDWRVMRAISAPVVGRSGVCGVSSAILLLGFLRTRVFPNNSFARSLSFAFRRLSKSRTRFFRF